MSLFLIISCPFKSFSAKIAFFNIRKFSNNIFPNFIDIRYYLKIGSGRAIVSRGFLAIIIYMMDYFARRIFYIVRGYIKSAINTLIYPMRKIWIIGFQFIVI